MTYDTKRALKLVVEQAVREEVARQLERLKVEWNTGAGVLTLKLSVPNGDEWEILFNALLPKRRESRLAAAELIKEYTERILVRKK